MKYLCHAVLHRGIVYYNTIIDVNQKVALLAYHGEEEATVFVNGIIAIIDYNKFPGNIINDLRDIVDECEGVEEIIDAVNPYLTTNELFVFEEGAFMLLAISPEIQILYNSRP